MAAILEYKLKQETPMLHFQHDQKGVILRGSDVKPRLDNFLLKIYGEESLAKYTKVLSQDGKSKKNALDYKLQIIAPGKGPYISDSIGEAKKRMADSKYKEKKMIAPSYFGNMVGNDQKKMYGDDAKAVEASYKETIQYKDSITLRIICFHTELGKMINDQIIPFFYLNNFGTRQDKGFGSFTVIPENEKTAQNGAREAEIILGKYSKILNYCVYKVDFSQCTPAGSKPIDALNSLDTLYKLWKSGINVHGREYIKSYLTTYMLKKGIGGEKRWMKKIGIGPAIGKSAREDENDPLKLEDYRYIRAVLGTTDGQTWKLEGGGKTHIKIIPPEDLSRVPSPILFTVIGKNAYVIATEPDGLIFERWFTFEGQGKSEKLMTPKKSEFDMHDFMKYAAWKTNKQSPFNSFDGCSYKFTLTEVKAE